MQNCDECRRLRTLIKIRQDDRYAVGELAEAEVEYAQHWMDCHVYGLWWLAMPLYLAGELSEGRNN